MLWRFAAIRGRLLWLWWSYLRSFLLCSVARLPRLRWNLRQCLVLQELANARVVRRNVEFWATMLRKRAAQSEKSLDELEGPLTRVRREKSQSGLAEAHVLQRRGKLRRWVAGQSESRSDQIWEQVTELKKCLE